MSKLSIVIPAYNEESCIQDVVRDLLSKRPGILERTDLEEVEAIVVNDGSTDRTGELLEALVSEGGGHLRVIHHEMNGGYGAALKTGFRAASGSFISFMDADGTVSPDSFIGMYKALRKAEADMVVGTRMDRTKSEMPLLRTIGNRFFATLLSFLSGERVRDSASGVRLFRKELNSMMYSLPDGLHFTPAMSTKAIHEKVKIVETAIPYAERSGKSKLNVLTDGLRFLRIIIGTVLMYNPFKVFLLVGLLFELIAALLLSEPIYAVASGERIRFSDYIYRSIGALYFSTSGVQITLFGVLARFMVSTFFKQHESGVVIHRINHTFRVYDWMGWYGVAVFGIGVLINAAYFWKYLFGGGLEIHWASLLLAAGMIIVGLQMMITGVVIRILKDIKASKEFD